MKLRLAVFLALSLAWYASGRILRSPKDAADVHSKPRIILPPEPPSLPLPATTNYLASAPLVVVVPRGVQLLWNLPPSELANQLVVLLEARSSVTAPWQSVTNLPWIPGHNSLILPATGLRFFRIGYTWPNSFMHPGPMP